MRARVEPARPPEDLVGRVERLLGPVWGWRRVLRGYTTAERWLVTHAAGDCFVKSATDELTAGWLDDEIAMYRGVDAPWMPRVIGFRTGDDGGLPLLVLESLQDDLWPPPWDEVSVGRVLNTLREVHSREISLRLPRMSDRAERLSGWRVVADDPRPFLAVGLVSPEWLERALPVLDEATATAPLDGDSVIHLDLRSDNMCLTPDGVKIIDWNWASRGNPAFDVCAWLPSLRSEGGPPPAEVMPGHGRIAALLAGYWCSQMGQPETSPGSGRRQLQRRLGAIALDWAACELELDPVTLP